jgi:hypothetical protein
MQRHLRILCGFMLIAFGTTFGCGVQDPSQPPMGSISVKANKDGDDNPNIPPGKKTAAKRQ